MAALQRYGDDDAVLVKACRRGDLAVSPARVREAVLLSGGTLAEEPGLQERRLRIRLPASRQQELLERLERLGRISERPAVPSRSAELLGMTIQW